MTERKAGRETRPACRPSGPARGGSSLMPPQSQGAERRWEGRSGRARVKRTLRMLVVGSDEDHHGLATVTEIPQGIPVAEAAEPETVRDTPGGDGPAPARGRLGAVNGVPADRLT
jgi:hypothetical protein